MDMKKLLEAVTKFAGEPEQKPGEQWRGTDKNPPGKKLVGDSILKDLSKGPKAKTLEEELAEAYAQFNEDDLGVEPKRPHRKGSRAEKVGARGHKEQSRYTYQKQETEESRGHKIIATKLKNIERLNKPISDEENAKHIERIKQSQKEYTKKNPNGIYKQVDENLPAQPNAPVAPVTDPQQLQKVAQATTAIKAATGSPAPAANIAKALDSASQGKAVTGLDAKVLEPLMKDVATVAQDPKLANQFKTLANQANQAQKLQQQPKV